MVAAAVDFVPRLDGAALMADFEGHIARLADRCPDYPSLEWKLPQGEITLFEGTDAELEIDIATLRKAVLYSPQIMHTLILGYDLKDFHEEMLRWVLTHPWSVIECGRGFGKSTTCTTTVTIVRVCRNFNDAILITSERDSQVKNFLREIRGHLENNDLLIKLFGEFRGKGKWDSHRLDIRQRTCIRKEGTIDALQMGGSITGMHWEHIVVDDPTSQTTARSEAHREQAFDFYFSALIPCLNPGGTLSVRATRYHYEDLLGKIEREKCVHPLTGENHVYHWEDGYHWGAKRDAVTKVLKFSAIMRDGQSLWPERFPLEDTVDERTLTPKKGLITLKAELGSRAFDEQYQMKCDEPDQDGERETQCREEWIHVLTDEQEPYWNGRDYRWQLSLDPAWTDAAKAARRAKGSREPCFSAVALIASSRKPSALGHTFFCVEGDKGFWSTEQIFTNLKEIADRWCEHLGLGSLPIRIERTGIQMRKEPKFYADARRKLAPHKVIWDNPQMDKLSNALPFFAACERGEVAVTQRFEGLDFRRECGDAPWGEWDMIDAVASGRRRLVRRSANLSNFIRRQTVGA